MGRLSGKSCLVTAAGQGIGRASAEAMRDEGGEVFATDVSADLVGDLEAAGFQSFQLNVLEPDDIAAAVTRTGAVDVLFNCAGFVGNGSILDCDEEQWDFSFDLNAKAMYRMIKAYLPGMLDHGGASIINMSSVASSVIAVPNRFAYGASKAAVIGLTKSIAADFITKGIRCNAICPGTVDSPSLEQRMRAMGGDYEAARASFLARQPMGRLGQPEEIAQLAVYLASDDSSLTTGVAHVIDGGWANT